MNKRINQRHFSVRKSIIAVLASVAGSTLLVGTQKIKAATNNSNGKIITFNKSKKSKKEKISKNNIVTEERTITRRIIDDQNSEERIDSTTDHVTTTVQSVTFTRNKTIHKDGSVEYDDWMPKDGKDSWEEYLPKLIPKDKLKSETAPMIPVKDIQENGEWVMRGEGITKPISAKTVTPDTPNQAINIYYAGSYAFDMPYVYIRRIHDQVPGNEKVVEQKIYLWQTMKRNWGEHLAHFSFIGGKVKAYTPQGKDGYIPSLSRVGEEVFDSINDVKARDFSYIPNIGRACLENVYISYNKF
ncbi:hypothetical protein [Lactobacillus kalixensis]|uniref:Uncharacterized protein n=1 Tax=Lactobacillus kalixensis DSM 16043 TaxID=1423763 RepID=A0A0R1UE35_9LACO|nr:hypothetical protein [Lactobacillus kalixensis]KRL88818.1 hypothetical protein FC46_GL001260 [Lactobacillus kalixensis DSM 16043]